jgi:VWFA-related protein
VVGYLPSVRAAAGTCLTLLALALPASAQDKPPETDPYTYGEVYSVEYVMVPVAVRGEKPGERLPKDRFTLNVDGKPVKIDSFTNDDSAPISLIFLQDLSGSMAEPGKMESSRESIDCFLDTARKGDEISLATFASAGTDVDVPLTGDVSAVREAMTLWEPWGKTALYDAVSMLPEISLGTSGGKKAAILITDGVDNASGIDPAQAQRIVQSAEIPVYVLSLVSHDPEAATDPATPRFRALLQQLAETTGGRFFDLAEPGEARRTCSSILGELRHQYMLGFTVTGTGPATYHPIRVDLRKPGRHVSLVHRRGYRGTAPEPS